jgi:5-methyltetrahydrofolate--homocysteine methyltransferase
LLTFAFDAMKATVDLVAESGLKDTVKVMIGGAQVNERVVDYTGADAFGEDASQAVKLANRFLGE